MILRAVTRTPYSAGLLFSVFSKANRNARAKREVEREDEDGGSLTSFAFISAFEIELASNIP